MNNDYRIRRAESEADADRLYDLFKLVFDPEPVATLAVAMFHALPRMPKDHWFIAEKKQTADVAAAFALIPWTWAMDGIRLKVAEMGLVGTHPDHRGRGLMRRLNREFDSTLDREGFDLAVIQGIPGFYHRFGYHYAVPLENHINLPLHVIPDQAQDASYRVRPADRNDIGFLMAEDEAYRNTYLLTAVRDEASWQYLLGVGKKTEYGSEYWIVEDANGKAHAYCRMPHTGFGNGLIVSEISEGIGHGTLLHLLSFFKSKAVERGKPYVRLNLHNESVAARAAIHMGASKSGPYAWQVKIPDKIRLIEKMATLLEQRLQKSGFRNCSETLRLDFYTSKIDLVWRNGRLDRILAGSADDCPHTFFVSEDLLAPLCLGHRTWRQLQFVRPDIFPGPQYLQPSLVPDKTGLMLDVLFPAGRSWIVEQY